MLKKSIASFMMLAMVFGVSFTLCAQESDSYTMWESFMITPDNTKLKTLQENMRNHNAKYHKEGPYKSTVYNIASGPNSGKLVWQMGPMMFSHNDTRPSDGGHDEDWRDNVMPYIKKMHSIEYWRQNDKLSNVSMVTDGGYPLLLIRYFEIEDGHGYSMNDIFKKVSATVKKMEGDNPWGLYYNEFLQGDLGRHVATVSFLKNWAELDEDGNFREVYEELHGENSWQSFTKSREDTFSNEWHEIWVYNKKMSGD